MLLKMVVAGVTVLAACVADLRTGKIPNKLTLPVMGAGMILQLVIAGWTGFLDGLLGWLMPVVLLSVFLMKGVIGAGDIKLLAAMGCLMGREIGRLMIGTFVAAAFLGVCMLLGHATLGTAVKHRIHMSLPVAMAYGAWCLGNLL